MTIVFFSLTGNVRRFVQKLGLPAIELKPENPFIEMTESFLFIIPSYEREITDIAWDFMESENNQKHCKGIIGSGNLNFDTMYLYSAKDLAKEFNLPLLYGFEYFGTSKDIQHVKEITNALTNPTAKENGSDLLPTK